MTWDPIACIERNGEITGYAVKFQEQGEARSPGEEVVNQSFMASGLRPYTNYTFRVAGVNINGTGPFSNTTIITTGEESMYVQHNIQNALILAIAPGPVSALMAQPKSTSIVLTWSAPQEPNGVVGYEVAYIVTTNITALTTTFTIPSLTQRATVSNISVTAFNGFGRGEAVILESGTTLNQPIESM